MSRKVTDEAIGWYGAAAILVAYALSSFNVLGPQMIIYQALNCTGALGIVFISFKKNAYQPGVLNAIWAIVAAIALIVHLK